MNNESKNKILIELDDYIRYLVTYMRTWRRILKNSSLTSVVPDRKKNKCIDKKLNMNRINNLMFTTSLLNQMR